MEVENHFIDFPLNGEGEMPIPTKKKSASFQHNSHKPCEVSSANVGFFISWVNHLTRPLGKLSFQPCGKS
jgi:hypothetical protein